MLMTETNTPKVERVLRTEAAHHLHIPSKHVRTVFEHGQWWVEDARTGAQWSAVDIEDTVRVFDFEQVSEGDE
jgi:hypothetical protein